MLEVLQFVFSSFWTWLGTVILLAVPCGAVANLLKGPLVKIDKTVIQRGANDS